MLKGLRISFMLFCNAALQYEVWCIYAAHHTYQLDRRTSKAGSIREGMAAVAAADSLPALRHPVPAGAGFVGDRSYEPVQPCPARLGPAPRVPRLVRQTR